MKRIFQKTVGKLTGSTLGANAGAAIRGSYRSLPEVSTYILICSGESLACSLKGVLATPEISHAIEQPHA